MDRQDSILKLTFDPGVGNIVLLNYGDGLLDGPLKFPQKLGKDIVPTADSPYPLILDKLNADFVMKFTKVDDTAASPAESMRKVLDSLVATADLGVKQLKIEVQGISGHHWLVQFCGVTEHEPWNAPDKTVARTVKGYTLACAGISYV